MFDADQIIFETVCAALPGQVPSQRRLILQALRVKLTPKHPAFRLINAQLAMLDGLDKLQAELHLSFNGGAK